MDLKTALAEPLWAAVESTYEAGNYSGAILDALYYLGDRIREKTGLESDGVVLVGQAFGGKSPKLRVNQLQTVSDWNVQKGTQSIVSGLFQSVRNPRSHGRYADNKDDADSIVQFIDYLVGVIGASKGAFSKNDFVERVFDKSFVENVRYAELLVEEIPRRYRLEVAIEVFRRKEEGELRKLGMFCGVLLKVLEEAELSRLVEIVSDELSTTSSKESVRASAYMFPLDFWGRLSETARMRSENLFIESMKAGQYVVASKKCVDGAFGTWCRHLVETFLMKEECVGALMERLTSQKEAQDYVFQFFGGTLLHLLTKMGKDARQPWQVTWAVQVIIDGLKAGDKRFYGLARSAISYYKEFWPSYLKDSFESFQEAGEVPPEGPEQEDIPF